jgi:hypothetical protein
MASIWKRLFGKKDQQIAGLTLLDYAENYLVVFVVATDAEKTRHAVQLFDAADKTAKHAGAIDFLSLIKSSDVVAMGKAAVYSREKFENINTLPRDYWLSAFALTHLMILNSVKSLEDTPRAKLVATNAAHLYSAEYARRKLKS